jgi:hypothetical protein
MPPKSKSANKPDCQQCKTCECVIGVRDLKKHAHLCIVDCGFGAVSPLSDSVSLAADSFSEDSELKQVVSPNSPTSSSRKSLDDSQVLLEGRHGFVKGRTIFALVDTLDNGKYSWMGLAYSYSMQDQEDPKIQGQTNPTHTIHCNDYFLLFGSDLCAHVVWPWSGSLGGYLS